MQTHISYVGLTLGLGALSAIAALVAMRHSRHDRGVPHRAVRWLLLASVIGVVLWVPPVVDQVRHSPGNLSIGWDYFRHPPEAPIGLRQGGELLLVHLDPAKLVTGGQAAPPRLADASRSTGGSRLPGTALLLVWAAAVMTAWRLRARTLLRLHLVLGVALVLGLLTLSRIFGLVWYYLSLWMWGIDALVVLAVAWTGAELVGRRMPGHTRHRRAAASGAALAALRLACSTTAGLMSMPWTAKPSRAAAMAWRPGPQPSSRMRPPGGTSSVSRPKKVALRAVQRSTSAT
jgi:hypothetical protein